MIQISRALIVSPADQRNPRRLAAPRLSERCHQFVQFLSAPSWGFGLWSGHFTF